MIVGNEMAQEFFFRATKIACERNKKNRVHWPDEDCFKGKCGCRKKFSWKGFRQLALWFWRHGPEVAEDWKVIARRRGFDPDDIHDLFLGVYIGGDGDTGYVNVRMRPTPSRGTPLTR